VLRFRRLSYQYALVMTPGQMESLSNHWFNQRMGMRLNQTCWRPAADIYETTSGVIVTVELPGIDPDQLDTLLYEDAVIIEGRRAPRVEEDGRYHAAEIRQGAFRLELPLPGALDLENVDASYDRGMLRLRFDKRDGR
jgi:HSP20 family protein